MSARLDARRPNGLELSCPAAQAPLDPFSRILAGKSRSNLPLASRVSCSELLGSGLVRGEELEIHQLRIALIEVVDDAAEVVGQLGEEALHRNVREVR
jgi:hypothetical protein